MAFDIFHHHIDGAVARSSQIVDCYGVGMAKATRSPSSMCRARYTAPIPPLPSRDSILYWPSSTVPTIDEGSSSRTSPSVAQKLTLSSYFALQTVQYFMQV